MLYLCPYVGEINGAKVAINSRSFRGSRFQQMKAVEIEDLFFAYPEGRETLKGIKDYTAFTSERGFARAKEEEKICSLSSLQ